ncbi:MULTISPECIES: endonuclease domain-containing protein [Rodentibacter]|uniref:endonuclease domain-containing protein n=1 Tax=Rodentibacter TaxID=1960084 RepID=UPI001CFD43A3|nr:endonuclease domain-containing protein [Rodentibacter sp. JRC1]GJI56775.1 hypothetical protein HEMROJRC1_18870 [Rodentibacter sp. JRC1]
MEEYARHLKPVSRILRHNMTEAEQLLWQRIRHKQLCSLQVYRQKPLLNYIVDFYCPKAKLVIELDGSQHNQPDQREKDILRDQELASLGIKVLRFPNSMIFNDLEKVIEILEKEIKSKSS